MVKNRGKKREIMKRKLEPLSSDDDDEYKNVQTLASLLSEDIACIVTNGSQCKLVSAKDVDTLDVSWSVTNTQEWIYLLDEKQRRRDRKRQRLLDIQHECKQHVDLELEQQFVAKCTKVLEDIVDSCRFAHDDFDLDVWIKLVNYICHQVPDQYKEVAMTIFTRVASAYIGRFFYYIREHDDAVNVNVCRKFRDVDGLVRFSTYPSLQILINETEKKWTRQLIDTYIHPLELSR